MELYECDDEDEEIYPCGSDCPEGSITFNEETGMWECDSCDFESFEI